VISYLTSRSSRDLIVAAHQQITLEWWEQVRPCLNCFVSDFVIQESERGDAILAQKRLEAIASFPVLGVGEEIKELAERYFVATQIPDKSRIDAFHLAIAAWHKIDYLLSWNCKHIANGRIRKIVRQINETSGIHTPTICTPEELMEV
jgi:hypothetical protein